MKRLLPMASVAVLLLLLAACGASDDAGAPGDTTSSDVPVEQPATTRAEEPTTVPPQVPERFEDPRPTAGGQVQSGEVPEQLTATIMADAAVQAPVDASDLNVLLAEFVIWSDGSLGCPQPGMVYTQALVEGYRVVLGFDGQTLDYRVNQNGAFIICDQISEAPSGMGTIPRETGKVDPNR